MNSKKLIPWILVLAFSAAAGFFFANGKKSEAELMQARQENVELQQLRSEIEELKKSEAQNTASLSDKEKQELIRLRNEVGQLKHDKQQLATQAQKAQLESERLLQTQQAQQAQQVQQLQQQNQQLAQQTQQVQAEKARNACINNLRQIDGAIQQWALENKQSANAPVSAQQITPYLPGAKLPVCPSGGIYTINNVSAAPTCSIPGHALTP